MPKFSGGIPSLLKEPIKLHHLHRDVLEQVDAHPKTPTKIALGICLIFIEIHPHQLVVAFNPFPPQLLSTKNQATNFWLLIGAVNSSMEMFSSSSISNSLSDESSNELYKHV
jgi:hypothetical protein